MTQYYDKQETMTAGERQEYLNERLRKAVRRAYRGAPAARAVFMQAGLKPGDITGISDLEKLPVTRKPDLIDAQQKDPPYGGYYIGKTADIERVFVSPGPVYEPLHSSRIEWFARSFWAAGFRRGDVVINTFTYHLSPAGTLFGEALRHCGATVIVAGAGNSEAHLRAIKDLKVNGFVGTPSYLMSLIDKVRETGNLRTDFPVVKAWFTGEMLAPSVRQIIEKQYGIDTRQAYAVTEPGGALAYECAEKSGLHLMDDYVIEIIDPVTGKQLPAGQIGEVTVTPVNNPHWGLVRFGTGDLSKMVTETCPCGRTAPRLAGLLGRTGEAVKVRGMFVVPRQVQEILSRFEGITRFQLVVSRSGNRDNLKLRLEKNDINADERFSINKAFNDTCIVKLDELEIVKPGGIGEGSTTIIDERKWD